ncbi:MAG: Gfo/Idh/MocA family oxidoreductase [Verrucomicrobiales bacterium]
MSEKSSSMPEISTFMPGTSRRKFLEGSAIAATAASLPIKASAQVAGGSTLRVALVGCGGRGSGAAAQTLLNDGVKLVAMADAFSDRLESSLANIKKQHGEKVDVPEEHKFIGLEGYKQVFDLCDVVILATPPGFRPMMFEAAVAAGKHIFMEKPVGTDAPGIRRVLEAARKADEKGLKVVVGLQRHYETQYTETLKQYLDGAAGDFIGAQAYWNGTSPWVRDRKEGMTEMEYQIYNWYYFAWLCGDHIVEQHIHNLDVINWFKGEFPVSAQGMGGREVRKGPRFGEIYDHHYVEFTYADGTKLNSQCRHQNGCWNRVSETIFGTKGIITPGRIVDYSGKTVWRHKGDNDPNPYEVEHARLYDAIRNDKPLNNAYYGAKSTFTAILGRYATYSGQNIKWDDALAADNSLFPERLAFDALPKVLPDADGNYPVAIPGVTKVL